MIDLDQAIQSMEIVKTKINANCVEQDNKAIQTSIGKLCRLVFDALKETKDYAGADPY